MSEKAYRKDCDCAKQNKVIYVLLVIIGAIAILGLIFSVHGMTQANKALGFLDESDSISDELDSPEYSYGKPNSVDEIDSAFIIYNGGADLIDIYDGEIEYYSYEDDEIGDEEDNIVTSGGGEEAFQYLFDNVLEYLGDGEPTGDEDWYVEIDAGGEHYSLAYGEGDEPEWFKALLVKLNVDEKGYQSRK